MADKYDPYREALIVETSTVWPDEYDHLEPREKLHLEMALHASPKEAAQLEYVRVHSGFCRQITVTPQDFERVKPAAAAVR
jgi:hypothetical protein